MVHNGPINVHWDIIVFCFELMCFDGLKLFVILLKVDAVTRRVLLESVGSRSHERILQRRLHRYVIWH